MTTDSVETFLRQPGMFDAAMQSENRDDFISRISKFVEQQIIDEMLNMDIPTGYYEGDRYNTKRRLAHYTHRYYTFLQESKSCLTTYTAIWKRTASNPK